LSAETGTLEVYAYADTAEVAAVVYVEGVGYYFTPFTLTLPVGTYVLIAEWMGQDQIKMAEVKAGEKTTIKFYFIQPPKISPITIMLALSIINTMISVYVLAARKSHPIETFTSAF